MKTKEENRKVVIIPRRSNVGELNLLIKKPLYFREEKPRKNFVRLII